MFDSICIHKELSRHDKVDSSYITGKKPDNYINKIGEKIKRTTGKIKNLEIKYTKHYIEITGSLLKFYFGNSYSTLTRKETEKAINKLSILLSVDLSDGYVSYLELSKILYLDKDIENYLNLFEGCRYLTKEDPNFDGAMFYNNTRSIKICNKKTDKEKLPKSFDSITLLKIEIKLKKRINTLLTAFYKQQENTCKYYSFDSYKIGPSLKVKDLYQEDTYLFLYDYWLSVILLLKLRKDACKTTYKEFINICKNNIKDTKKTQPTELYTKSSRHYENNRIQTIEDYTKDKQLPINTRFDHTIENTLNYNEKQKFETLKKKAVEYSISYKGIDLSEAENKVIHSIQTLMTSKGYYTEYLKDKEIKAFEFTPSEFLDAYGVKKHINKDGKYKYSGEGRKFALQSLREITKKQCYVYYEKTYWKQIKNKQPEKRVKIMEIIEPLLTIVKLVSLYDLADKDKKAFLDGKIDKENKLVKIAIQPNKVLVDQIDKYFVMKPSNYLTEMTEKYKRTSKFTIAFIDLLFTYVSQNTNTPQKRNDFNWSLERDWETLAINIRINESSYWKQNKQKKCREIIIDSYNKAKEFGYITKYEANVKGKTKILDKIYLNKDKFYQPIQLIEK